MLNEYEGALGILGKTAPPLVIVQHPARLSLQESYGSLRSTRVLKQGDNLLSFFEPASSTPFGHVLDKERAPEIHSWKS
jgi:hypothetical protein